MEITPASSDPTKRLYFLTYQEIINPKPINSIEFMIIVLTTCFFLC